jgi:hypothetical protein
MQMMDKRAFSVATLRDEGDDRAYWQVKTAIERLEAVEQMRRIIYGYDPATRLQRLFEVVERECR